MMKSHIEMATIIKATRLDVVFWNGQWPKMLCFCTTHTHIYTHTTNHWVVCGCFGDDDDSAGPAICLATYWYLYTHALTDV